jgi:signal transduction histidine kinase
MADNKILWMPALVTLLMGAAVALAGAWLWADGLREHERILAYELLEEGGAAVPLLGAMTLDQFERRARQLLPADPGPFLEIARDLDDRRGTVAVFDFEGNLLSAAWTAPEIAQLLDAGQIDRRRSLYTLNGEESFTEDNYARYNAGEVTTPARAYFRVYDELGWVMGFGQVQATAAARLNHAREQAALHLRWNTLLASLIGGALLLLTSCICAWATRRWLLQPARQLALLMGGELPAHTASPKAPVEPGADLAEARTAAALERQARREAEEARDQLRADFDREVAAAQALAEASAAETVYENRVDLLRRVARGLGGGPEGDALRHWLAVRDRSTLHVARIDLDAWLGTLLDSAGPLGIVRHFEAPGEASINPDALEIAVRALLDNASAAVAGRPDGRVSINTERTSEGVEIRIVDNGPGVADGDRPHIFAPLWSSHADAMGLGLPVAAHLIALHGGTLTVHSETGKGAAFVVSLPAASS